MTTCLKRNSYETFEANNGEEALDILENNYIDLVITDIMMPKMNGYELIKALRQSKYNVPILLVTAKDKYQDKEEGFLLVQTIIWLSQLTLKKCY